MKQRTSGKEELKKNWEYNPETGEEQESFIPNEPKAEKKHQFIGDLFHYQEGKE